MGERGLDGSVDLGEGGALFMEMLGRMTGGLYWRPFKRPGPLPRTMTEFPVGGGHAGLSRCHRRLLRPNVHLAEREHTQSRDLLLPGTSPPAQNLAAKKKKRYTRQRKTLACRLGFNLGNIEGFFVGFPVITSRCMFCLPLPFF